MIKTQKQFAEVVGETYTNVRNVLGRHRGPRQFGDVEQGLFTVADAFAWRIVRKLTHLGMTWDEASDVVRRERCADLALRDGVEDASFFAVWEVGPLTNHELGAWTGTPTKIAEIVEYDAAARGDVTSVRMVSLQTAYSEAVLLADQAGYRFEGDEIIAEDGGEA
jgi:hypothetical protein